MIYQEKSKKAEKELKKKMGARWNTMSDQHKKMLIQRFGKINTLDKSVKKKM